MAGISVESRHNILAVVDSLELLNIKTSAVDVKDSKFESFESTVIDRDEENVKDSDIKDDISFNKCKAPYMEVPMHKGCLYKKMTEQEWIQLKSIEDSLKLNTGRHSSVHFVEKPKKVSQDAVKRGSILKNQCEQPQSHHLNPQQNALHPIQVKCQELMKDIKIKSILELLCDDETIDMKILSSCDNHEK